MQSRLLQPSDVQPTCRMRNNDTWGAKVRTSAAWVATAGVTWHGGRKDAQQMGFHTQSSSDVATFEGSILPLTAYEDDTVLS